MMMNNMNNFAMNPIQMNQMNPMGIYNMDMNPILMNHMGMNNQPNINKTKRL